MLGYLNYVIKSTNAHGVHSPFVYQLITKCIYLKKTMILPVKTMFKKDKYTTLTHRLITYFKPKKILNLTENTINIANVCVDTTAKSLVVYDAIFVNSYHLHTHTINNLYSLVHNDSWLLVKKDQSPKSKQLWLDVKDNTLVTVSIDLYALGLVFFRKEQLKQDFTIRF